MDSIRPQVPGVSSEQKIGQRSGYAQTQKLSSTSSGYDAEDAGPAILTSSSPLLSSSNALPPPSPIFPDLTQETLGRFNMQTTTSLDIEMEDWALNSSYLPGHRVDLSAGYAGQDIEINPEHAAMNINASSDISSQEYNYEYDNYKYDRSLSPDISHASPFGDLPQKQTGYSNMRSSQASMYVLDNDNSQSGSNFPSSYPPNNTNSETQAWDSALFSDRHVRDVDEERDANGLSPTLEVPSMRQDTETDQKGTLTPTPRNASQTLDVQPNIDDIGALLDPHAYFQSLDDLEGRIIEECRLREIFRVGRYHKGQTFMLFVNTRSTHSSPTELGLSYEELADSVLVAVELLRGKEFCRESVTILVEDGTRDRVIQAISIDIAEACDILHRIKQPDAWLSHNTWNATSDLLLRFFFLQVSHLPSHEIYRIFCCLLLLALLSYAGSHCSFPSQRVWGYDVDAISLEDLLRLNIRTEDKALAFRKQHLQCLDRFIGGPVSVFARPQTSKPAMLDISPNQFAELWGPTFAIPLQESFEVLIALKVEGGVIHRVAPGVAKESIYGSQPDGAEILMHFTPTGTFNKECLKGEGCSSSLVYDASTDERLPKDMLPFSSAARLLIGQPTGSVTQTAPPPSAGQHVLFSDRESRHLLTNPRCKMDLVEFLQKNHHRLRPLGTREALYVPDQLQASFGAGMYINPGFSKVWRRRPASTYKTLLLEYCSKPKADLHPILSLNLGLELSICTGNAQRVTLWDALILSHPSLVDTLRDARDSGDSMELFTFISRLGKTGLDERNHLSLFWPFKNGYPDMLVLSTSLPTWCNVLNETMTSACFATMSQRCLTYQGKDRLRKTHQRITRRCHGDVEKYSESVLQTTINFHPESYPNLPLCKGTRLMLCNGFLEMRNTALAFYHANGVIHRIERAFNQRTTPVHHELLDPERAGSRTLTTCIMDDL